MQSHANDCRHNAARYRVSASSEFYGGEINMILAPPASEAWLAVKNGTWKAAAETTGNASE